MLLFRVNITNVYLLLFRYDLKKLTVVSLNPYMSSFKQRKSYSTKSKAFFLNLNKIARFKLPSFISCNHVSMILNKCQAQSSIYSKLWTNDNAIENTKSWPVLFSFSIYSIWLGNNDYFFQLFSYFFVSSAFVSRA